MHRCADLAALVGVQGDIEGMTLYAGQAAALVCRTQPAADIAADTPRPKLLGRWPASPPEQLPRSWR
ncbi:hypothetical protein ACWDKQ_13420 [Saccharopolyspora sp. NPDC000995]